jgi:hypothetical protein
LSYPLKAWQTKPQKCRDGRPSCLNHFCGRWSKDQWDKRTALFVARLRKENNTMEKYDWFYLGLKIVVITLIIFVTSLFTGSFDWNSWRLFIGFYLGAMVLGYVIKESIDYSAKKHAEELAKILK